MREESTFIARKSGEGQHEHVQRIFYAIADGLKHYRNLDGEPVPIRQNWILWVLSFTQHPYFKYYEFYNGYRALARGTGYCSQYSLTLWYFLRRAKIRSSVIYLDGHVVTEVTISEKETWTLDADYRVIIRRSVENIRITPGSLRDHYHVSPHLIQTLEDIFQSEVKPRSQFSLVIRLYFENITFLLQWFIPIFLLSIWIFF